MVNSGPKTAVVASCRPVAVLDKSLCISVAQAAGPGAEGTVAVDQLGLLALDDEDGIRPGILKVVVQPVPGFQVGIQDVDVVEAREKGFFLQRFQSYLFPGSVLLPAFL